MLISEQYPEPYFAIQVPISEPGMATVTHVLAVVVRAWTFSAADEVGLIPRRSGGSAYWTRTARSSAARPRLGPADPFIGKVTPARTVVPDSGLALDETNH